MATTPLPPDKERSRMVLAAIPPALVVLLIGSIHVLEVTFSLDLGRYGIHPRHWDGLIGILTAPFLHASWEHLGGNAAAIAILGWSLMYFYPRVAGRVVLWTWLIGGACVWLMGRSTYHIGASGVVYGITLFLLVSGFLRKQRTLMALALIVVFLYGSFVWGMLPIVPDLSWESHLWGAVVGTVLAFRYRAVAPAVQDAKPVTFSLDDDDDEEEGPSDDPAPVRPTIPVQVVYSDPGDEADEDELAWKRRLAEQERRFDGHNTSSTWRPNDGFHK